MKLLSRELLSFGIEYMNLLSQLRLVSVKDVSILALDIPVPLCILVMPVLGLIGKTTIM
jgi:hypothetical protein